MTGQHPRQSASYAPVGAVIESLPGAAPQQSASSGRPPGTCHPTTSRHTPGPRRPDHASSPTPACRRGSYLDFARTTPPASTTRKQRSSGALRVTPSWLRRSRARAAAGRVAPQAEPFRRPTAIPLDPRPSSAAGGLYRFCAAKPMHGIASRQAGKRSQSSGSFGLFQAVSA